MAELTERERKARTKPGGSNVGKYDNVKKGDFCGPAGGAPAGSYPVNTLERAKSALKLAHNAPNPQGIKNCVYSKYPELKPGHAAGGPTSLYGRMYKKGGKTSLCGMGYAAGGMPEGSPYDNMRYDGNFKKGGKINYLEYRNMYYPLGFGGKEDSGKKHHHHMKKQGYYDREDESDAMRLGKGHSGKKTRDESYGDWGKRKKDWSKYKTGGVIGHMDALKDDVIYDQDHDYNSMYKDENQTYDEKKITHLASHLRKLKDTGHSEEERDQARYYKSGGKLKSGLSYKTGGKSDPPELETVPTKSTPGKSELKTVPMEKKEAITPREGLDAMSLFAPGASIPGAIQDFSKGDVTGGLIGMASVLPGVNPQVIKGASKLLGKAADTLTKSDIKNYLDWEGLKRAYGRGGDRFEEAVTNLREGFDPESFKYFFKK